MTSGGEFIQSRALLKELRVEHGNFVLSTNAYDSHRVLTRLYGQDQVIFTPWDVGAAAARALDIIQPRALVFVLCAYYPVLLRVARRRGIKTVLVNGLVGRNAAMANPSMARAV